MKISAGPLLTLCCISLCCSTTEAQKENWITTWAASPSAVAPPADPSKAAPLAGAQLTDTVHVSVGGSMLRVRFSNAFNNSALVLDSASIALHARGTAVPLRFAGASQVTIPAGAEYLSDPASITVPPLGDVDVLFRIVQFSGIQPTHMLAVATHYALPAGAKEPVAIHTLPFLTVVEVAAPPNGFTIVCLGDSITDGYNSTQDANHRYPDELARRLHAGAKTANIAVANAGISGNRLVNDDSGPNALARLDRDVLAQSNVKYLIVLEGINDINRSAEHQPGAEVTVAQLTAAYRQIVTRAHAHGIRVIGATLTPSNVGPPESQIMLDSVNQFIRTGGVFDAVVDLNAAVRDPENPQRFLPAYDSGDHLHPSDAGYKAMASAIDLALFTQ